VYYKQASPGIAFSVQEERDLKVGEFLGTPVTQARLKLFVPLVKIAQLKKKDFAKLFAAYGSYSKMSSIS